MEPRKYKNVRSLGRGLEVLAAVNALPRATVAELSEWLGLHRTTVYRYLETLEALGYLRRRVSDETFCVAHKARELSSDADARTAVIDAATPHLRELLQVIDWPSSLMMRGPGADMVIAETTHGRSRIRVHDARIGTQAPLLTSAVGRAYLAYCSDSERDEILADLTRTSPPPLRRGPDYVERIIQATRETGYASSRGESWSWLTSIALPVRTRGEMVASLNIVFLTSAVAKPSAIDPYVPILQRAVDGIEATLAQMDASALAPGHAPGGEPPRLRPRRRRARRRDAAD